MSADDRLPTALLLDIHFRRFMTDGVPYYVLNKGAYAAGMILLKLNGRENGCMVMQQQRDLDGNMGWMVLFKGEKVEEADADAYIQRAIDRDPDLWAVEIEDRALKNPFEGKVF